MIEDIALGYLFFFFPLNWKVEVVPRMEKVAR